MRRRICRRAVSFKEQCGAELKEVTFIGTSDAFGAGGRRQSAIYVKGDQAGVLLDCGGTTLSGMASLGISRDAIDLIVISHFHADHFGGLPGWLLAALYQDHRSKPLHIVGPAGIEQRIVDASRILGHPMEKREWSFPIQFHPLEAQNSIALLGFQLQLFSTYHNPDAKPCGIVLEAADKRLVFSGDTGWFDDFPKAVGEADLLICECTYATPSYQYHLSLQELKQHASRFRAKRIILTHFSDAMQALRSECDPFEVADDGLRIPI